MHSSSRVFIAAAALSLFAPTLLLAHEGGLDVRGTIDQLNASELVVRAESGEAKRFAVTQRTDVRRGTAAAQIQNLRVGERVVVHARNTPTGPEAVSIRVSGEPRGTK